MTILLKTVTLQVKAVVEEEVAALATVVAGVSCGALVNRAEQGWREARAAMSRIAVLMNECIAQAGFDISVGR